MTELSKTKKKVLVAMSGGVDSSVAAALLVRAGYDVTGAFMIQYDANTRIDANAANTSCWVPDYRDAVRVAARLGIPLLKLNFQKEYKEAVLDYMFDEYKKGRTPNPDVLCNTSIKFGAWLAWARAQSFDYLATGHYARIGEQGSVNKEQKSTADSCSLFSDHCSLLTAKDKNKDQTYFLHQLSQDQLQHVLFPIGHLLKPQVRALARKFHLPTAEREESMGICFIGEVPMKEFLQQKIKPKRGKIVLSSGEVVGEHDGLAFYTIGQRHFGVTPFRSPYQGEDSEKKQQSNSSPRRGGKGGVSKGPVRSANTHALYVVSKNLKTNELIVGTDNDPLLYKKEITIDNVQWIAGQPPSFPLKCEVRLRHRQPLQRCEIRKLGNKEITVKFVKLQRAPTPGQFAVFYRKPVKPRGLPRGCKGKSEYTSAEPTHCAKNPPRPARSCFATGDAGGYPALLAQGRVYRKERLQGAATAETCLGGGTIF